MMVNELSKLEQQGAKITPVNGGLLIENFESQEHVLDELEVTRHRFHVELLTDDNNLPEELKDKVNSLLIKVKELDEPDQEDLILKELMATDDPTAPIASGGHYHGAMDVLQQLTLTRNKLKLTEGDVSTLKTKHAIYIPPSSANLESNAGMLQRVISSRVPLPFDRPTNENKIVKFAEDLSKEMSYDSKFEDWSDVRKKKRMNDLVNQAIRSVYSTAAIEPVRLLDTGEILDGEVIPPSIQKFMRPYEAKAAVLPTKDAFHVSATLTALTAQFHHLWEKKDEGEAIAVIRRYDHIAEGRPEYKDTKDAISNSKTSLFRFYLWFRSRYF
eukprot:UN00056